MQWIVQGCCSFRRALHQHRLEISRGCDKDTCVSLVEIEDRKRSHQNGMILFKLVLGPGTSICQRGRPRMMRMSELASRHTHSATSLPIPSCTRVTGFIRICKVHHNGVEGIPMQAMAVSQNLPALHVTADDAWSRDPHYANQPLVTRII